MKTLPTLYSRTNTGAIQEWTIEIDGDKYRTVYGQVDGKKITTEWTTAISTNTGRANARDGNEQAIFEAKATWKKKKDSGYWDKVEDIDNVAFIEPMLAQKYEDRINELVMPMYTQPKLDGCLHGDTLVDLINGESKTIRDIVNNKLTTPVKTFNIYTGKVEYITPSNWMIDGIDINETKPVEWFELILDDGRSIKLTGNHRVWVTNLGCWRRVDELDGSEELLPSNLC